MENDLIGKTINRYQITSQLETTGTGLVFKGVDGRSKREVIIRLLPDLFTRQAGFEEQFFIAARNAARLDYPGIVKVIDYGKYEKYLYFVMDFIPGKTLAQRLEEAYQKHEFISQNEVLQFTRQVVAALDYANKHGVIHIDVQPSRITLKDGAAENQPGQVMISDLGLAWLATWAKLPQESKALVAPAYLSPEQTRGAAQDIRSDVYQVGVLLYELTTVRPPFAAKTIAEMEDYFRKDTVPSPRLVRRNLTDSLEQVILTALQKDANQRFADMASFTLALDRVALRTDSEPVKPAPPTPVKKNPTQAPKTDSVLIEEPNQPSRTIPVKQGEMGIGRGKSSDIPLNSEAVSRSHAKLVYNGHDYHLIDLGSTNGTYIEDGKLLVGVPSLLTYNNVARIGPFTLKLLQGSRPPAGSQPDRQDSQIYLRNGNLAEQKNIHVSSGEGRIGVVMEEDDLEVAPGETVGMTIVLRNQGYTVDHFRVTIEGVSPNWVRIQPQVVNLMPDNQASVQFTFNPLRISANKAGEYPLTIIVSSTEAPDQKVKVVATLTVLPYVQFASDLHPKKIDTNQKARVTIQNQGNRPETFALSLKDDADKLVFTPPKPQVEIPEGQQDAIEFSARTKRRQWMRRAVSHPYKAELNVASGSENKWADGGEVMSNGLIPVWLLPMLLLVAVALALLLPKSGLLGGNHTPTPTPTAIAFTIAPVQNNTQAAVSATPPPATLAVTPTPTNFICGISSQMFIKGEKVIVVPSEGLNWYVTPEAVPLQSGAFPAGTVLVILDDKPKCQLVKDINSYVLMWNIGKADGSSFNGYTAGWVIEADMHGPFVKPAK